MRENPEKYLLRIKKDKFINGSLKQMITILSFVVVMSVFWGLKLTGITLAGDAFCGYTEHVHNETCMIQQLNCQSEEDESHSHKESCYEQSSACSLEEHVHIETCYSDINADIETKEDWNKMFSNLNITGTVEDNLVIIAKSQLGYEESTINFSIDQNGIRRGITRYGQWYGNPYGDWSAMFAAFCLDYAGMEDYPSSAGPENMRFKWVDAGMYVLAENVEALPGYLVFFDDDDDYSADRVGILTEYAEGMIHVIEGNVPVALTGEDGEETFADRVVETTYEINSPLIMGYGVTSANAPIIYVNSSGEGEGIEDADGMMLAEGDEGTVWALGDRRTIWIDGTCGGLMSYGDSPNKSYSGIEGQLYTLPTTWQSPSEYSYTLRGWYDVVNNKYYAPGASVTITGNMVFYPDWEATSYDIGQFNSQVANTVSTNEFVTTRMFDYNILFNVLSSSASVSFGNNNHTETWKLLTSGNNPYNNQQTLNYIFRDWDEGSKDITYPNGVSSGGAHYPTNAGKVYSGLYNDRIGSLLFDKDVEAIGKEYLGTADHLFQLCTDPNDEYFGYYYYDSQLNAASYNQSEARFYVYEYLEQTTVSSTTDGAGKYTDFLPFNSPYANLNGNYPATYTYAGKNGEYNGVTHYMYDATNQTSSNVASNFLFGMSIDIAFYLPNKPGTDGNKDVYGNDMHFEFSGDDDVWVFVDGKLVLDLGGIHGVESGDINFTTGDVTINGTRNTNLSNTLKQIGEGEHVLTMYYLERGSSMSNCAIYFNLAPRFSFSIQKEDVLTRDVLNGAQFSVYTDEACTVPAKLWESKADHDSGKTATNVFTVKDGVANMWGMGAGNTYYIKETQPPDKEGYGFAQGIIRVTIDKTGTASYNVEIIDEKQKVSNGFTVHGFRIDEETQQAYIVATNAPTWVAATTSVFARKVWADDKSHSGDDITVYLTITDKKGTVTRLQEGQLNQSNNWSYQWDNLPKYWEDGTTLIQYGVEEEYIPGYYGKVEQVDKYDITTSTWQEKTSFEKGKTYLLRTASGYLSTRDLGSDTGYTWVNEETAKSSMQAQWTVSENNGKVKFTNKNNQNITFYYNNGSSGYPTDFFASTSGESNESKQYMSYTDTGNGLRIYYDGADGRDYYLVNTMTDSYKFKYSTTASDALLFTPLTKEETKVTETVTGWAYLITNTPLEKETSLTVYKEWYYGNLTPGTVHEQAQVTVRLFADGKDTGRALTLNLKNNWTGSFQGLPYTDSTGRAIMYTVVEVWEHEDWSSNYGEIVVKNGDPPTYSTTITNSYRLGGGRELPATGTLSRMIYVIGGASIMMASLIYGFVSKRKQERGRR